MKKSLNILTLCLVVFVATFSCSAKLTMNEPATLKDALADKFYIGTAMNTGQINGTDTASLRVMKEQFSAVVAENCMKSEVIQPEEGKFDFTLADKFVDFAEKNKLYATGHVLIWHSQAPKWFFVDADGKDVSPEVLKQRMIKHISTLVGRYKGRIKGWDVVNEAFEDDGSWRKSKFYEILGEDYIKLAFEYAHDADPDAELYYNDYSMAHPGRRDAVVKMVNNLKQQGIKVDGIGMQGHMTMNFPTCDAYEKSILAFASTGAKVMITEMDMTVLPPPESYQGADVGKNYQFDSKMNPYPNGLPDSVATALHDRYAAFFRLFLKHSDKISRVTVWGVSDAQSWRNNWPMRGRTDYPLLFDRKLRPKPIVKTIISQANAMKK
ncbi:MAG TPA: endo-1,4-beta-xylanase [Paludibacteraceae bacterium]|nr:endo-1,4-beta-xylanase [Paludibacteraceae bacterium]